MMRRTGNRREPEAAFTLVELIIALTVVAILAGLAIPAVDLIKDEQRAREPVRELVAMIRETRARAIAEQRPYQIAFDYRGFYAARYFNPYGKAEEFEMLRQEIELLRQQQEIIDASAERAVDMNAGSELTATQQKLQQAREGMQFQMTYELPENYAYRLRFYGDTDWIDMTSGQFKRWVFQPSGMCEPMRIQIEADNAFFEVEFHPLTGDVKSEKGWVE
ncbi:MAG: prepilin-type N-terminal cleavage/methylation domain-containing protein [Verrucomicrobiales bacterium]|nr:prepilin-type N-terminal cleavage/methylation domain-containing protein [Verrucomicrobiales bacterium]